MHIHKFSEGATSNMQLNWGYLTIELYSINLICQLCIIV